MKNKVQLITYADRLGEGTLASLTDVLRTRFDGVYEGVHILPFFTPFDGADAGFDPIDLRRLTPAWGAGMMWLNCPKPTTSWLTLLSTICHGSRSSSRML